MTPNTRDDMKTKSIAQKWTISMQEPDQPPSKEQTNAEIEGYRARNMQFLRMVRATKNLAASFEDGLVAARTVSVKQIAEIGKLKRLLFARTNELGQTRAELDALMQTLPEGEMKSDLRTIRDRIKVRPTGAWTMRAWTMPPVETEDSGLGNVSADDARDALNKASAAVQDAAKHVMAAETTAKKTEEAKPKGASPPAPPAAK